MKRNTRKFTVNVNDKLHVEYGWMDKRSVDVMYLYIKCWISPNKEFDYTHALNKAMRSIMEDFGDAVSNDGGYYDKFIFDSSYNVDKVNVGDKRFLSMEAFLRLVGDDRLEVDIEHYDDKITALMERFCARCVDKLEHIGFEVRLEKD